MNRKKLLLACVVILVSVAVTVFLIKMRQPPRQQDSPFLGPLVEFAVVETTDRQVLVRGTGTVEPRNEIRLAPQVSGRVSEMSPQMVTGGFFRKGEQLFAVEDIDYRLAIELARANLAQKELELIRTRNLAEVARSEWQALAGREGQTPSPLATYEPQMKSANAQREAAVAAVAQAELNLARTRILAPFNCFVRSEQVDLGQFLGAGVPVATVTGTDQLEIIVPLPLEELDWLQVPGRNKTTRGAAVRVSLRTGTRRSAWQGEIVRMLGDIDPLSRMARVVVVVTDPYAQQQADSGSFEELRPGMFVEVEIHGQDLQEIIAVPRGALRHDNTVWVIDDENRLRIRSVDVLRRERDEFLLRSGLAVGERVVLTNLSGAADGMLLRPKQQETAR